jgi:hypothetical protein
VSRPTLFVGSSSEGKAIAQAIQYNLDSVCQVELWTQGVFGLTRGTLESLVTALDGFDFAVLVLTADDLNVSRGTTKRAARDNVLFELGLFIGALGPERTFIVCNGDDSPELPTDLAGVTLATFLPHTNGNLRAALGACCLDIQLAIEKLGSIGPGSRRASPGKRGPSARFLALHDDSEVAYRQAVSGVVAGLHEDATAWIVVQAGFDDTYWPQRSIRLQEDGAFETFAQFGRSDRHDVGQRYELLLVVAPADVNDQFTAFTKGAAEGLLDLPSAAVPLARISVTRR